MKGQAGLMCLENSTLLPYTFSFWGIASVSTCSNEGAKSVLRFKLMDQIKILSERKMFFQVIGSGFCISAPLLMFRIMLTENRHWVFAVSQLPSSLPPSLLSVSLSLSFLLSLSSPPPSFLFFFLLSWDSLTLSSRLALNLQQSFCPILLSAGITCVSHQAQCSGFYVLCNRIFKLKPRASVISLCGFRIRPMAWHVLSSTIGHTLSLSLHWLFCLNQEVCL